MSACQTSERWHGDDGDFATEAQQRVFEALHMAGWGIATNRDYGDYLVVVNEKIETRLETGAPRPVILILPNGKWVPLSDSPSDDELRLASTPAAGF